PLPLPKAKKGIIFQSPLDLKGIQLNMICGPTCNGIHKKGQKKRPAIKAGRIMARAATYSPGSDPSTIGAAGLNFSVRDGKRWGPCAGPPNVCGRYRVRPAQCLGSFELSRKDCNGMDSCPSFRAISTARLCSCLPYTCGLSTSSSTTALLEV